MEINVTLMELSKQLSSLELSKRLREALNLSQFVEDQNGPAIGQTLPAQFIRVCSNVKRAQQVRISSPFRTRSHAHRRGSSMPVLSYVHQLFNANQLCGWCHTPAALDASGHRHRRSGDRPPPKQDGCRGHNRWGGRHALVHLLGPCGR